MFLFLGLYVEVGVQLALEASGAVPIPHGVQVGEPEVATELGPQGVHCRIWPLVEKVPAGQVAGQLSTLV